MRTSNWKTVERKIAEILADQWQDESIKRIPVTGRVRGDVPDISHPFFAIEVKHRKKLPKAIKELGKEYARINFKTAIGRLKDLEGFPTAIDKMGEYLEIKDKLFTEAYKQAKASAKKQGKQHLLLIFHENRMRYEDSIIVWIKEE